MKRLEFIVLLKHQCYNFNIDHLGQVSNIKYKIYNHLTKVLCVAKLLPHLPTNYRGI